MMRPQMNRQKKQVAFINELKSGNDVVTSSGMIGKVTNITGNIVTLQLADKVFIKVFRSAISKEMTDAYGTGKENEVAPTA